MQDTKTTKVPESSTGEANDSVATEKAEEKGTFTVLLFASASSFTGHDSLTLSAPMSLKQLFEELEGRFPGIKRKVLKSSAVTVNLEYVEFEVEDDGSVRECGKEGGEGEGKGGTVVIRRGDEVGIIPPVSSG